MSEEEIIYILKQRIERKTVSSDPYYITQKAIEGLLDLYQKEKDKNKLLIEGKFREVADKNSYIKDNYISKDKIRELLAKYKLEYDEQWCNSEHYYKFAKDVKELLEE